MMKLKKSTRKIFFIVSLAAVLAMTFATFVHAADLPPLTGTTTSGTAAGNPTTSQPTTAPTNLPAPSTTPPASSSNYANVQYAKPDLEIPIPGVSFSNVQVNDASGTRTIDVPFLAQYLAGIYAFLVGISTIIATIVFIWGGGLYLYSAGNGSQIGRAKTMMTNAVYGLILALGTYTLLRTIDPSLVTLNSLRVIVPATKQIFIEESESDASAAPQAVETNFQVVSGDNISGAGRYQIPADLASDVTTAAQTLKTNGYGMLIASSFRSIADQTALILRNCQNAVGSATCNPKPGKPQTCILKDKDPRNCPHTTGRAIDIWGTQGSNQCILQTDCLASVSSCRTNPCQAAVISAMQAQGFCVSSHEPWHFEKPKMSSDCS